MCKPQALQVRFQCSQLVSDYVEQTYGHKMSNMEQTYLTVHLRNMRKGQPQQ